MEVEWSADLVETRLCSLNSSVIKTVVEGAGFDGLVFLWFLAIDDSIGLVQFILPSFPLPASSTITKFDLSTDCERQISFPGYNFYFVSLEYCFMNAYAFVDQWADLNVPPLVSYFVRLMVQHRAAIHLPQIHWFDCLDYPCMDLNWT